MNNEMQDVITSKKKGRTGEGSAQEEEHLKPSAPVFPNV